MQADSIKFKILPNGLVKTETDGVSDVNHHNAEQLLRFLEDLLGGDTSHQHKREGVHHHHDHAHEHDHDIA